MISLLRRTFVAGPFAQTVVLLDRLIAGRADATLRLAVRAPVPIPSLGTDIMLVRDVVVTISKTSTDVPYDVRWQPTNGGPFPRFRGTLALTDVEGTHLALDGHYEIPDDGVLVRDAFLAHRIAQATAGEMLAQIASELEQGNCSSNASAQQGAL